MAATKVDDDVQLKFLFANQDGVHLQLSFPKTATVSQVKTQLMRSWPQNVPPAEEAKAVRLICMGRGILQDAQTVGSAVPTFDTHPTPVNISVNHSVQPAARGTRALLRKVRRMVGS
uniref:UBL3-like ubiquitin domain-containing protein n=1 Tax=Hyaloperonospora arabidopsidis (strain Emoy2) TaxID=559515 RepID=M4B3P9_HYAAE